MKKYFLGFFLIVVTLQTSAQTMPGDSMRNYEEAISLSAGFGDNPNNRNDSTKVIYEANAVFQYGGESKLTILPKFNLLRKHQLRVFNPYYGIELGLHPLFSGGAFTFSGVGGIEKGIFNAETSLSHFRTTRMSDGQNGFNGPFSQNLWNVKLGVQIMKVRLKVGTSFLLNENIPAGQERISLLDFGKINGTRYGVELQFRIR